MKIYKALIVDDESPARDIIKHYLKTENRIDIIGECENGFEAVKLIQRENQIWCFWTFKCQN